MEPQIQNLLGMPRGDLEAYFSSLGEKAFRARQLMRWMYRRSVLDVDAMTDLSHSLRGHLAGHAQFGLPPISRRQQSEDGTVKWLLDVGQGQEIETVFIPEAGPRDSVCVFPGWLCNGLPLLCNGSAGVQSQFDGGGNNWSGIAGDT